MIQHSRAARLVLGCPWRKNTRDGTSLMLQSLRWPTLQLRRKCTKLILMYKLVHNLLIIPSHYLAVPSPATMTKSSHAFKFFHYQPALDCYKYLFLPRTVSEWNNLPLQTVQEPTSDGFRKSLYNYYIN